MKQEQDTRTRVTIRKTEEQERETGIKKIKMNTITVNVDIQGGNPGGRSKYFLNDENTIKKLKKAAANKLQMEVKHNSDSQTILFSTGSYVTVVLPLLKAWQEIQGRYIDEEQVGGLAIMVDQVTPQVVLGDRIERYQVKMIVDGHSVTVTLFDTTLSSTPRVAKLRTTTSSLSAQKWALHPPGGLGSPAPHGLAEPSSLLPPSLIQPM